MSALKWDSITKFPDEHYYDLHWIIIRRIKRLLDERSQCLYAPQRNIPDWFKTYFIRFETDSAHKNAEIWNKTHEKIFFAHCLICNLHKIRKNGS